MELLQATEGRTHVSVPVIPGPAISLVIPAYNEEAAIRQAVREAVTALRDLKISYEVIVVDDGSTDGTVGAATLEAALQTGVRVVSLPKNAGYAAALQHGFRIARYELVAFTDADCQFDLHDLGRLLPLTNQFDVVCGYRLRRKDVWRRRVLSGGFNLLVRTLLGTGVRDCDCAMKIMRRDWVNSLELSGGGFFFNAELLALARMQGLTVAEAGVTHRPRESGESKVSLRLVLPVFVALLRFWWSRVVFPVADCVSIERPSGGLWAMLGGTVALAAIGAAAFLPWSSFPLMSPDEARYAEIAREMHDSGNLIVPTSLGQPYLDKPPLLYWLTAASYGLFGTSINSARLIPLLAAMFTVFTTFWLGAAVVGRRSAWLGAVLLLTCAGFLLSGRFLFMDTLLSLFTTITVLAGYAACRGPVVRKSYWVIAAIACGLGLLTKGPVAVVLCVPPLLASRWLTVGKRTDQPRLGWSAWCAFAGIAALIAVPWFVAINFRQGGGEFAGEFLWTHHVARFLGGLSHQEPWWYFIPVLIVCMLPCSILYPALMGFLATRDSAMRNSRTWGLGYLLLASLWIVTVFSLSSCKLPPYVLPAVPLLCLATGVALRAISVRKPTTRFLAYVHERSPRDLLAILAVLAVLATGLDVWRLDNPFAVRVLGWATVALLGGVLLGMLILRQLSGTARWGVALSYALLFMGQGMGSYHAEVAARMSVVEPIESLCRNLEASPKTLVCYSICRLDDAIAFHFRDCETKSFEFHQCAAAVAAIQKQRTTLLLAQEGDLVEIVRRLPPHVRLSRVGQARQVIVTLCTSTGNVEPVAAVALVRR